MCRGTLLTAYDTGYYRIVRRHRTRITVTRPITGLPMMVQSCAPAFAITTRTGRAITTGQFTATGNNL